MIAFGGAIALNSTREYELLVAEAKRKEHEAEELREALRLRLELLLAASHDLRTPLNSIVGYLELLGGGAYGELDTAQRDVLAHLIRNSMSLLEIINTLIDHGRLEQGQVPLRVTPGELSQLLEELRLMIEPLAGVRPVRIRFEASGPLVRLETDWLKLKRILLNLLHNALKFTERGEIALEVSHEDGAIRFRVRDSGAGIAPKDLQSKDPAGDFTRTGFRLPLMVISPYTKPHFVSHQASDTTSILKFIEKRFNLPNLTKRDAAQPDLDFFDFTNASALTPPTLPPQPAAATCAAYAKNP